MRSRNKYHNRKTIVDGITFDSKLEARRYSELKMLERGGVISGLELQPRFLLQESFTDGKGKKHRKIEYVGDFMYKENGACVVEDTKGRETDVYKIKKKLLLMKYREIDFREVRA